MTGTIFHRIRAAPGFAVFGGRGLRDSRRGGCVGGRPGRRLSPACPPAGPDAAARAGHHGEAAPHSEPDRHLHGARLRTHRKCSAARPGPRCGRGPPSQELLPGHTPGWPLSSCLSKLSSFRPHVVTGGCARVCLSERARFPPLEKQVSEWRVSRPACQRRERWVLLLSPLTLSKGRARPSECSSSWLFLSVRVHVQGAVNKAVLTDLGN